LLLFTCPKFCFALLCISFQLKGRPERLRELRAKVRDNLSLFKFLAEEQNQQEDPAQSFETWTKEVMTHIKKIEGLGYIKSFSDLAPDFDKAKWTNKSKKGKKTDTHLRNDALAKLACDIIKHLCGADELGVEICSILISQLSPRHWSAIDLGHQNPDNKTGNPSAVAKKGILKMIDELLSDEAGGGLLAVYPPHHDRGESRTEYELDLLKRVKLIKNQKSSRTDHRTIRKILSDEDNRKDRFMLCLYIIDSYVRGSHTARVTISQSTERVMYFAYFGGLADDITLYPAAHRNSNSSFNSHKESHRLLMKHLVIESRCCAGAKSMKSSTSTEYALPDAFFCFRNLPAFEYYGIDQDHEDESKKNHEPTALATENIITMLNELAKTKSTTRFSHRARTHHQCKGKDEICYYTEE
jgi:hypothetical protein